MHITTINHPDDDLPRLPPGLIVAWDICGSWPYRAAMALKLMGMLLALLHPLRGGSRLYVVDGGPQ